MNNIHDDIQVDRYSSYIVDQRAFLNGHLLCTSVHLCPCQPDGGNYPSFFRQRSDEIAVVSTATRERNTNRPCCPPHLHALGHSWQDMTYPLIL